MPLLAYFISFRTYGSWLHGQEGSVDGDHNTPNGPFLPPNPDWEERNRARLTHPPLELDAERRFVVDATIRGVCRHRGWNLHALHARTTHVHAVVSSGRAPERVLNDFKAYATRRMREAGVLECGAEPWSHHGSTRYLNTEDSFAEAVHYVLCEQGEPLPMTCPPGWVWNEPQANEPRA